MPTREQVMAFVDAVVNGNHVDAISNYYTEDATMQENLSAPRKGRESLMTHERKALSRLSEMRTHSPSAVLIDGDRVAIHWTFDAVGRDGRVRRLTEISLQYWRGDRIAAEQFFYDSATAWQLVEQYNFQDASIRGR